MQSIIRPSSLVGGSYHDYDGLHDKSAFQCAAGFHLLKEHMRDGAHNLQVEANRMTCFTSCPISRLSPTKHCVASLSTVSVHDSSDESTCPPITPPSDKGTFTPTALPPVISHVNRYLQREKGQHKPYQRDGPSTLERHCAESQLHPGGSATLVNEQELEHLSFNALAQALLTKEADVEWRCLRTLTMAWEIYTLEQHQRFLHMVLEDYSETYASATSEPFMTSIEALSHCNVEELQECINLCQVIYNTDTMLFAAGYNQLDIIEDIACVCLGDGPKDC
ncbi:uncharacterized protein BJ212DRAFT_1478032 [Suillus subaureus]|uniref:Uncharacterized protein n=1 Tax=Suillus subaureus TaxID=48587 RepID=A0A9P7EG68_9AGAM|nr:uncharacterized protein BJ212DRAFT_1478032 [Suillus subaureus]KAG1820942.1 hypothetical protein BJ212DRAFT_1478032 [Suillus subaureus]